jgi:hypothetical protein
MEKKDGLTAQFQLRMAAIVCSTILGVVALVGAFWGSQGMIAVGIALAIGIIGGMWVIIIDVLY